MIIGGEKILFYTYYFNAGGGQRHLQEQNIMQLSSMQWRTLTKDSFSPSSVGVTGISILCVHVFVCSHIFLKSNFLYTPIVFIFHFHLIFHFKLVFIILYYCYLTKLWMSNFLYCHPFFCSYLSLLFFLPTCLPSLCAPFWRSCSLGLSWQVQQKKSR